MLRRYRGQALRRAHGAQRSAQKLGDFFLALPFDVAAQQRRAVLLGQLSLHFVDHALQFLPRRFGRAGGEPRLGRARTSADLCTILE